MGNSGSSEQDALHTLYSHYLKMAPLSPAKQGGGSVVLGGFSDLEDYSNSVYSKAKVDTIRKIAASVAGALGIKPGFAQNEDIGDVIEAFKKHLPNPREKDSSKKRSVKNDKGMHENLCLGLAKSINEVYGRQLIDDRAEAPIICEKVSELMYSLFTGVHTEFLTVTGDIARLISNRRVLKEYMDAANRRLIDELERCDGAVGTSGIRENAKTLYNRFSAEMDRQDAILANLMHSVAGPTNATLVSILEDNKDFAGLTRDLKEMTGTPAFGDKLNYLLSGTADITHAANLVNKALNQIGLKVSEYKAAENMHDLRKKIYDAMSKRHPTSDQLHKMLVAADVLYRHDLAHDDISSYLEQHGKSKKNGGFAADFGDAAYGGAAGTAGDDEAFVFETSVSDRARLETTKVTDGTPFEGRREPHRRSVEKQLYQQKLYRKQLLVMLNDQIKDAYVRILSTLGLVAKKFGTEIEASPEIEMFLKQLSHWADSQPNRENIHVALSGYRKDSQSMYMKYQYVENLLTLSETLGSMTGVRGSQYFRELKLEIDNLLKLIDEFNDKFTKTMSEPHIDFHYHKSGGANGDKVSIEDVTNDIVDKLTELQDANNSVANYSTDEKNKHITYLEDARKGLGEFREHIEKYSAAEEKDYIDDIEKLKKLAHEISAEIDKGFALVGTEYQSTDKVFGFNEQEWADGKPVELKQRDKPDFGELFGEPKDKKPKEDVMGGLVPDMSDLNVSHYKTIQKSIRELNYNYRIIGIKGNMARSALSYEENTENYENILGEEAGFIIDTITTKYNDLIRALEVNPTPAMDAPAVKKIYAHGLDTTANHECFGRTLRSELDAMEDGKGTSKEVKEIEGGYKYLLEFMRQAKIEMIEAAEDLDLYLSKFTQEVQLKPDQIKDFVVILEQLSIVAKWANEDSGNVLAGVFETFDCGEGDEALKPKKHLIFDAAIPNDGDNTAAHKVLTNINGGGLNKLDGSPVVPKDRHYYELLNDQRLNDGLKIGKYYLPRILTKTQAINFVKSIEKSFRFMRALDNVIKTFSRVNISVDSRIRSNMQTGEMFQAFLKYCVASVISVGYLVLDDTGKELKFAKKADKGADADAIAAAADTNYGAGKAGKGCIPSIHAKMAVGLRFNRSSVKLDATRRLELCDPLKIENKREQSTYDVCDKIFEMCIKSMFTKVSVVVQMYELFNRPARDQRRNATLPTNPLRQIIGGGARPKRVTGGAPEKVYPEAAELYLRLPLLVEWYKKIFQFKDQEELGNDDTIPPNTQGNVLITLIPDNESIWGELLKVIFIDAESINDGAYPVEYAHKIIASINDIYKHYITKNKSMTCKDILLELVSEVNKRYGFVMRSEITTYLAQRNRNINVDEKYPTEEDRMDFDVLGVEDVMGRSPVPSDRFRTNTIRSAKHRDMVFQAFRGAVIRFRQVVEANLVLTTDYDMEVGKEDIKDRGFQTAADASLSGIIRETKRKMERAKDEKDKYRIVHEQLHGVEKFGDIEQQKMLLFHETVVTPLTVLYFVYLLLNNFNRFFTALNIPTDINDKFYTDLVGKLRTPGDKNANIKAILEAMNANYNTKLKGNGNQYKTSNTILDAHQNKDMLNSFGADHIAAHLVGNAGDVNFNVFDNVPADQKGEFLQRFMFDNSLVMETTLNLIMDLCCDVNELTDVYFVGSGSKNNYPVVNYDKLQEYCTNLFSNAKQALHQFKKSLPSELIDQFEKKTIETGNPAKREENRISLFYIQDQLFDRLFGNKYGNGLIEANNGLHSVWTILTKKYSFNNLTTGGQFSKITGATNTANMASRVASNDSEDLYWNTYGDVFSKLGFWDVTKESNRVRDSLGIRTLVCGKEASNQNSTKFPAKYVEGFRSGAILSNGKNKEESKAYHNMSMNDKAAGIGYLNKNIMVLNVKLDPDEEGKKIYDAYLGCNNLYNYDDKFSADVELKYSASADDFHLSDKDMTAAGDDAIRIKEALHRNLGLIPKFNNLLYKYVTTFMDISSKKIYRPLLEKFVNGYNAKDILQGKNINDRVLVGLADDNYDKWTNNDIEDGMLSDISMKALRSAVCLTEPKKGAVLFASLANAIRGIMIAHSERTIGTPQSMYVESDLANVSEYQLELMRAYLPVFEKELAIIIRKAEFLRRCLEETQVRVYKYVYHVTPANDLHVKFNDHSDSSYTQANTLCSPELDKNSNGARKSYLISIYDDIATSAKSLLRCVEDVQKELNDIPLYFETYQASIVDFNNRNGFLPLMPISHITHLMNFSLHRAEFKDTGKGDDALLRDDDKNTYDLALVPNPDATPGSALFKFNYGTRGILHYKQKPSIEYAPGMMSLLDSYNNKLGGGAGFDKSKLDEITQGIVVLSRWVLDYMYHKQVLGNHDWFGMQNLLLNNQMSDVDNNTKVTKYVQNLSCQTGKFNDNVVHNKEYWGNTTNIIMLSESENMKQSVYRMVSCLRANNKNKLYGMDRDKFRVYNILDLNIVPINVHALQREIPFINLLNYSYTFDHMIKNFIGIATKKESLNEIGGEIPTDPVPGTLGNKMTAEKEQSYSETQFRKNWHPEDTMVRNLIWPLGYRRLREYVNNTNRIMVGNTSLSLGKPKYLSDQLWNKVLLNSVYNLRLDINAHYDEGKEHIDEYRDQNEARRISALGMANWYRYKESVLEDALVVDDQQEFLFRGIVTPMVSNGLNKDNTVASNFSYMTSGGKVKSLITKPGDTPPTDAQLKNLQHLGMEGYMRYQSKIIRWLEWFVQLQRVMRLLMRSQLKWMPDPLVQGSDAISEEVTEFENNNVIDPTYFD
jgi:hypothetical protein